MTDQEPGLGHEALPEGNAAPGQDAPEQDAPATSQEAPKAARSGVDWLTVALVVVALANGGLWLYNKSASSPPLPATTAQGPNLGPGGVPNVPPPPGQSPPQPGAPSLDAETPPPPGGPMGPGYSPPPPPGGPMGPGSSPPPPGGAMGPGASPPPPGGVQGPTGAGGDRISEYLAAKQVLLERDVDVSEIEEADKKAIEAGQAGERDKEADFNKKALDAASRLLEESFTSDFQKRKGSASPDDLAQAEKLAREARELFKAGMLTLGTQKFEEALKVLGGS